ncbi:hypothetical protein A6U87_16525 [Rhizobium sp. AC44/96]|uniref:hypothetical protein n=1 Tax=Rhizobium sp. AC44/96 TaxID=1841654 RepID=UPI00080FF9CF|nr:hypothetical protein [Rhizobium sp. AC44/96]OCJ04436.1 hypothetical protein A6U87_16525 [Rhizobium sp. AC44/96]
MIQNKPPTLGMFRLKKINVECSTCGRHGIYDRDRAIEQYGADCTMFDFFQGISNCRKSNCKAGCMDLIYMFMNVPEVKGSRDRDSLR